MKLSEYFDLPRLRMFAGPNGSGKSTIKLYVSKVINEKLFGFYINPDEFEKEIKQSGFLDFTSFNLEVAGNEILGFFNGSAWLRNAGFTAEIRKLNFGNNKLDFTDVTINSYFASVAADFIRRKFLEMHQNFYINLIASF